MVRRRKIVRRKRKRRPLMPSVRRPIYRRRRGARRRKFARPAYSPFTELKFLDGSNSGTIPTAGIVFGSIVEIPEGTGRSERIGRKAMIKHVMLRFNAIVPPVASSGNSADIFRVVVYQDKQTNGSAATVPDILDTTLLALNYQSFKNLTNSGRFRILYDRSYSVNALSGTTGFNFDSRVYYEYHSRELNIPIEFNDSSSTGDISSMSSNNIGYFVISRAGDAQWEANWRVRYQG